MKKIPAVFNLDFVKLSTKLNMRNCLFYCFFSFLRIHACLVAVEQCAHGSAGRTSHEHKWFLVDDALLGSLPLGLAVEIPW